MTVIGVFGVGVCVGMFRMSALGVDPFQTMMSGINKVFPALSFGMLNMVINGILLLFALVMDRRKIGIGTVINLFFLGYVIDYSHQGFLVLFPSVTLLGRVLFLTGGVIVMCMMIALYFTANMGVSTYDAVALILTERNRRLPFKYWRIITDSICIGIGVGLFLWAGNGFGEMTMIVGIGTLIAAFFMGPLITFFNKRLAEPMLRVR